MALLKNYATRMTDSGSNLSKAAQARNSALGKIGSQLNDLYAKATDINSVLNRTSGSSTTSSGRSGASKATSARSYSGGGGGGYDYPVEVSDPYGDAMNDLNNANARMLSLLKQNYDNAVNNINAQYDYSQQTQENDSAKALREAYVNYMMSNRNIGNDMNRAGVNGGVAESTRAKMYNNYGNNRNAIRTNLQDKLAQINLARNSALAEAEANYNNALVDQTMNMFNKQMALRNQYM